jgi:hypothetical protein
MEATKKTPETFFQKERRLKARKQVYKETYKKGLFFINKEQLCEWIKKEDVLIRVHNAGKLNDETEFINITIEGFVPQ